MENNFDIYCITKFSFSESRFARLCAVDPVIKLLGNKHYIDDEGYLGISLTQLESMWISKILRRMGIESYPVPERYKLSAISASEALSAAQEFIAQKRILQPDYEYAEIQEVPLLWWLSKIAYGFFSKSEKMMREGVSPAGSTICVDRVSGLIMQERELVNAELPSMLIE